MPEEKLPPIREGENVIQIDAKKGKWPWLQALRFEDGSIAITIDMNEGGQVAMSGVGTAGLKLSKKKARRLREFLERTEELFD